MESIGLIVILALFVGMMFFSSRKEKQRQAQQLEQRKALKKGDKVMTGSGLLAEVVEVDLDKGEVVVSSEGAKSRWVLDAIQTRPEATPVSGNAEDLKIDLPPKVEEKSESDELDEKINAIKAKAAEKGDAAPKKRGRPAGSKNSVKKTTK